MNNSMHNPRRYVGALALLLLVGLLTAGIGQAFAEWFTLVNAVHEPAAPPVLLFQDRRVVMGEEEDFSDLMEELGKPEEDAGDWKEPETYTVSFRYFANDMYLPPTEARLYEYDPADYSQATIAAAFDPTTATPLDSSQSLTAHSLYWHGEAQTLSAEQICCACTDDHNGYGICEYANPEAVTYRFLPDSETWFGSISYQLPGVLGEQQMSISDAATSITLHLKDLTEDHTELRSGRVERVLAIRENVTLHLAVSYEVAVTVSCPHVNTAICLQKNGAGLSNRCRAETHSEYRAEARAELRALQYTAYLAVEGAAEVLQSGVIREVRGDSSYVACSVRVKQGSLLTLPSAEMLMRGIPTRATGFDDPATEVDENAQRVALYQSLVAPIGYYWDSGGVFLPQDSDTAIQRPDGLQAIDGSFAVTGDTVIWVEWSTTAPKAE